MDSIAQTAGSMQEVFSRVAEKAAEDCQLIKRRRRFTGTTLVTTFVFGFLRNPKATWADLADTARERGVCVTPQAVEQRVKPELRDVLAQLCQSMANQVIGYQAKACGLLERFTGVFVGDSSTVLLGDDLAEDFPGCGGTGESCRAALKVQAIWDYLKGGLRLLIEPARQSDAKSQIMDQLPPAGSLSLFDLGYFSLERFRQWGQADAFWISRGSTKLTVYVDQTPWRLLDWLKQQPRDDGPIDICLEVGSQERLPCRLVALRVPDHVAEKRRRSAKRHAARKGRQPTRQHLEACDWTIFLTNCDEQLLSWKEVVVLYRVRWQIELLFKLWKSHNQLANHRTKDPVRQMVEFYARLCAAIVQHWLLLTSGWHDTRLSLFKAARWLADRTLLILDSLDDLGRLIETLRRLETQLTGQARVNSRRKEPSCAQLLENPELLTYSA